MNSQMVTLFSLKKLRRNKIPIFLTVFLILTLVSVATVYVVYQQNVWQSETTVLAIYDDSADYSYVVHLLPNSIYQNRTVLLYNEVIYASVVDDIALTLDFSFDMDVPSTVSVDYSLTQTMNTSTLEYEFLSTSPVTFNDSEVEVVLPSLNIRQIEDLKEQMEIEQGLFSPYYSVVVSPLFSVTAVTDLGTAEATFNPKLILSLESSDQGNIFSFEGLNQQEPGEFSKTELVADRDVLNQQLMSLFFLVISVVGLSLSVFSYIRIPRPDDADYVISERKWRKLVEDYPNLFYHAEKIIAGGLSQSKVVNVASIEDLMRLAESADNPVMYVGRIENRRFILIDRDTLYQFQNRKQTRVQRTPVIEKLRFLIKKAWQ